MVWSLTSAVSGIRFWDKRKNELLSVGMIDSQLRNDGNFVITEFALQEGERILGVRSRGKGERRAFHFYFSLVVGRGGKDTWSKLELLKFFCCRCKLIALKKTQGKLPEGVFREVAKYLRY